MCLIIHRPANVQVPQDWLENGFDRNSHGWGLMTSVNGKLVTSRGLKWGEFSAKYGMYPNDTDVFIHFRYATHGNQNTENCHPFTICRNRYAVMHNGVIPVDTTAFPGMSDTYHFARNTLGPLLKSDPSRFGQPGFASEIHQLAGPKSKLVILRSDGQFVVVNRESGVSMDSIWLSNKGSIEPVCRWYDEPDTQLESFEDFQNMEIDEIESYLWLNPEHAAELIREHFEWSQIPF